MNLLNTFDIPQITCPIQLSMIVLSLQHTNTQAQVSIDKCQQPTPSKSRSNMQNGLFCHFQLYIKFFRLDKSLFFFILQILSFYKTFLQDG